LAATPAPNNNKRATPPT